MVEIMKLGHKVKYLILLLVVFALGFAFGHLYIPNVSGLQWTYSSELFSTGTLVRNIGIALFAVSVWLSQDVSNKAKTLLNALNVNKENLTALEVILTLRDSDGLKEMDFLKPEDITLVQKKIAELRRTDTFRNLAISLFIIGVIIEIFEVLMMWLRSGH
jgi:hypothetical protein